MANVKKVMGYRIGDFQTDEGKNLHYVHLFTVSPADGVVGLASEKFKVDSDDVLGDVEFGQFVELYFNDKAKVVLIQPIQPTPEILASFYEEQLPPESIVEE